MPSTFAGAADLSISLPLGPVYRPGKYLPVHVTASVPKRENMWIGVAGANVNSRTDISRGAGRTGINVPEGRVDAVVPWLVMEGSAPRPRMFAEAPFEFVDGPELKRLDDSERLVGWTTPDDAFARQLLGGAPKVTRIALDPAQPIKGHPAAWEMLDAIILDAASAARLDQSQIAGLLACGVIVAVKTDAPPFPAWPWRRMGEYAVLKHDVAGPTTSGYHEQAYLAVSDWQAGWSWAFRRRVVLIGAVCCLLMLGLALWRPPHAALWAVLLAGALCFGIGHWWGQHLAIQQAAGEVVIIDKGLTQTDGWTYQTVASDRAATLRWTDVSRPIFASNSGVNDVWMSLNCSTAGQPTEFDIRIPAKRKVAFLSRMVGPRAPRTTPQNPVTSPLAGMVDKLYVRDGPGKITGELPGAAAGQPAYGYVEVRQWNAVVVDRR